MANATCSVDECHTRAKARGLCDRHLQRLYRSERRWPRVCEGCGEKFLARWHGTRFCYDKCTSGRTPHPSVVVGGGTTGLATVESATGLRPAFLKQDWDAVLASIRTQVKKIDGCWVWGGSIDDRGYGRVTMAGRRMLTHRVVAIATNGGPLPAGMQVHHTCANTACCNPDHLQVVTPADNAAEMRDRHRLQRRIQALEAALSDLDPGHPLLFII